MKFGQHLCFVAKSCPDPIVVNLCQYDPGNRTCRHRTHAYLRESSLCVFITPLQGNPRNKEDSTRICRRVVPTAIPLELTSPEMSRDLKRLHFKGNFRLFWTGLEKWEVKWPQDSRYDPTYTNWDRGEPDSDTSKLCIAVSGDSKWANHNCHIPMKFICQIPRSSAPAMSKNMIDNPCAAGPVIKASKDSSGSRIPVIPLGAGIAACVAVAAVSIGIGLCFCGRKRVNKPHETLKEDPSENKAYGTIKATEELREEVYDELNEENMTNYASLGEMSKYDDPPNDERYRRLTTSSDHSGGSGSLQELTKNEVAPAQEDVAPGPALPPRDLSYTKLSLAKSPKAGKGDDQESDEEQSNDVFNAPEGDTDNEPAVPPRVYDNRENDESEQLSQPDSQNPNDPNYTSNDYLKLVG